MKKIHIAAGLAFLVLAIGFGGYWYSAKQNHYKGPDGGGSGTKMVKVQNRSIPEALKATAGDEAVRLGDLTSQNVSVQVAKGAFASTTEIELVTPEAIPEYPAAEAVPIGSPVEIKSSGDKRLEDKMTITFAFDPKALPPETYPDQLWISYFNGRRWDYLKPSAVDMEKGTIVFDSYHFSLFGANKVDDDTVITEHWIHSKTLDDALRGKINDTTDAICNKAVELTLQKMGISDKSMSGKVLTDILTDDSYKEMHDALSKKDVLGFNQKLSVLLGKKIADRVPESMFKSGLEAITDDAGVEDVEAVAKAAGYAAEGQYKEAAKIIGEQIADKFLLTTAGKIAVDVVNHQIESWKDTELEAAYLAYRNGSGQYFYGYNNDPKDFDTVWDQMRGIRRQLEIEAIARENAAREEAGMPPLTDKQMDMVRDGVKNSFQRQFENRVEEDVKMEAEEKKVRMIVDAYKKAGFLDRVGGLATLDKGLDMEGRLDVMYHFAEKIMKDTKRFQVSDKEGLVMKDKISLSDIVQGARYYFSGPEGKKAYAKFLKDRFGISLYPALKDLAGAWPKGKMVITDVILSDDMKAAIEKAKTEAKSDKDEGCDFTIDFEKLKGKESEADIAISAQSETAGTMTFAAGEDNAKTVPITYAEGVINGSFTDQGAVATLNIEASEEEQGHALKGTVIINYQDKLKILASLTASRGKTTTPPTGAVKP